jgi:hypothetical protein
LFRVPETIDSGNAHRYNVLETGWERESSLDEIAKESETVGESFANERRMNGTREPRSPKAKKSPEAAT